MKKQQLKKGEEEIKQLREARTDRERVHTCDVGYSPEQSGPSETATRH
jgi:hypothetical protein